MSQSQPQEHPVVHMACRRGSDKVTAGQACGSKKVFKLSADGASTAQFRCCKCGFGWDVAVGGTFTVPAGAVPPMAGASVGTEVHMACRRGSDRMTAGQKCDGKRALKLSADGSTNVQYQCCKCGFGWGVALGGTFQGC